MSARLSLKQGTGNGMGMGMGTEVGTEVRTGMAIKERYLKDE